MDFGFTEEQEKLRKEVRNFYLDELPEDYSFNTNVFALNEELQSFWMNLQRKAAAKGYLTPGWPEEYAGLGLGSVEQGIVDEEEGYAGVRWPSNIGLDLAGPATILFGTEEQKKKVIPPLARGEVIWFEAFTEPDAGSDEANVQLRAIADGDYYVLNGQKMFITGMYQPDYLYTLVRTKDIIPKHRGLSLFLVPTDTPGISFRPLLCMGGYPANEIFFDDVKVPKDALLGELNRGFYHAMATFEYERSGMAFPAGAQAALKEFVQFCKEERRNGKPLIEDPHIREMLAQMAVEVEVYRLVGWHTQWWFGERERLGAKPYDLTGYYNKVVATRHAELKMKILGLYGQLRLSSKWAKLDGRIEKSWQAARSLHAAGTLEIYKLVLAQRGLGLPRAPRPVPSKNEEKQ